MAFREVVLRVWRDNHLFSVLLELTYRCNLDCFFCYNDVNLRGRALAREDWFRLLDELRELEVLNLILSGGEPLAHPDFFAIGARARDLGFVVRLKSNGHALRGRILERVHQEVDPFLIETSLHGARAATHDRQTRVAGSFERLIQNLEQMRARGMRVKLNSTLTSYNEGELEEMFALADRLGMALQVDPDVTPRDDGDREPLTVAASADGTGRLLALQAERRRRSPANEITVARQDSDLSVAAPGKHCGAGSSTLAVDPFGNVYPCVQWRRPIGNLHEQSIAALWRGSGALAEVRELNVAVAGFVGSHGPAGKLMAFCPGSAEAHGGDPMKLYPAAERRRSAALAASPAGDTALADSPAGDTALAGSAAGASAPARRAPPRALPVLSTRTRRRERRSTRSGDDPLALELAEKFRDVALEHPAFDGELAQQLIDDVRHRAAVDQLENPAADFVDHQHLGRPLAQDHGLVADVPEPDVREPAPVVHLSPPRRISSSTSNRGQMAPPPRANRKVPKPTERTMSPSTESSTPLRWTSALTNGAQRASRLTACAPPRASSS